MPTYAPPFHSEVAETSWNTGGASKASAAFTPPNDSLLVAVGAAADKSSSSTQAFSSAPALTWTARASNLYASNACPLIASTAPVASGVSMTATLTYNAALADLGFDVLAFVGHGGVGASVISSGPQANAPSINITTTQDNSAVVLMVADWNANAWAARSWLQPAGSSAFVETATAQTTSGQYSTLAGYYPNVGAAGTKTLGLPTTAGTWTVVAVEILGTDGNTPLFCGSVADNLAATAHTVTNDRPIPAGTRLFAKVDWVASSVVTLNSFAGGSLTWSRVGGIAGGAGAENMGIDLWTAVPAATVAPGTTFTGTLSGAPFAANLTLFHHLNAQTASIVDGTIVGTARTSPTSTITTPSATTANADDDLFFFALSDGPAGTGGTAFSVSAPWTEPWPELKNASNDWSSGTAFQRVTSPGSYSATGAWGTAPTFGDISMFVAIKNVGAAVPSGTGIGSGTIGSGTIGVRAAGTHITVDKTGGATAGASAGSGLRHALASKTSGGLGSQARTGGPKNVAAVKTGGGSAVARTGGPKNSASIKTSGGSAVAQAGGPKNPVASKSGGAEVGLGYRRTILNTSGLMGYWRLGELAGTVARDELGVRHGVRNAGTILSAPGAIANDADVGTGFTGATGGTIDIANAPAPTAAITIEAWVTPGGGDSNARIVDRPNTVTASPYSDWALETNAGGGYWAFEYSAAGSNQVLQSQTPMAVGYTYVVATFDGVTARIYLNGVEDNSVVTVGALLDRGMPLRFGGYGPDPNIVRFAGNVDEVAIYGRALNAAEVAKHYAIGVNTLKVGPGGTATSGVVIDKAGGALTLGQGGGAKLAAAAKVGGGQVTQARAGGARTSLASKTAGALAALAAGGPKLAAIIKVGGGQGIARTGGGKLAAVVKTGGAAMIASAGSGARHAFASKAGGALASAFAGSPKTPAIIKSGGAVAAALGGGARAPGVAKTGGALGQASAGGPKSVAVFSYDQAKAGGAAAAAVAGGADNDLVSKTGGALGQARSGGLKVAAVTKAGGALSGGGVAAPTGTALWFGFEEGSGIVASDSSGNGRAGTLAGGADWVSGKVGTSALRLDGASGTGLSFATLNLGTVHSVAMWMRWQDPGDGVTLAGDSGNYAFYFDATNVYYSADFGNYVTVAHGGLSGWQHWAVTRNGALVTFYKNGVVIGSDSLAAPGIALTVASLGRYGFSAGNYFEAQADFDDVRAYSRVLTSTELGALYNPGSGGGATAGGSKVIAAAKTSGGQGRALAGAAKVSVVAKTGGAVAAGVAGASKVADFGTALGKAGGGIGAAIAGSPKLVQRTATGGGQAITRAGTPKNAQVVKTAGAAAMTRAGGPSFVARALVKAGGGLAVLVAGGAKLAAAVKAGGGLAVAAAGGVKNTGSQIDKAGGPAGTARAGGARNAEVAKVGGALAAGRTGGVKVSTSVKSGGSTSTTLGGGAKFPVATKSGGAVAQGTPGGTKQPAKRSTGGASAILRVGGVAFTGRVIDRAGGAAGTATAGGAKAIVPMPVKAGGASASAAAGGTWLVAKASTGGGRAGTSTGGSKRVQRVVVGGGVASGIAGAARQQATLRTGGGHASARAGAAVALILHYDGGARATLSAGGPVNAGFLLITPELTNPGARLDLPIARATLTLTVARGALTLPRARATLALTEARADVATSQARAILRI